MPHADTKPLGKSLFIFALPLMLSTVLQSTSGTVSTMLLGRMVGLEALAAVAAFVPILFVLMSFIIGIGSGSTVLIGQAYGAGDHEALKKIMGTTLSFTFLLGLAIALAGGAFTREVLVLTGTPANIIGDSMIYARITFFALPVIYLYTVYTTFLRGTGDAKTPFYFLILSTVVNIALTPVLILGWLGLPALGVSGAAWGSVISSLAAFLLLLAYLERRGHPLKLPTDTLRSLAIDWPILWLLIKLGVPTSLQMLFISLSEIAVLSFVNSHGSAATAAYGAVSQIITYVEMPAVSLGTAVSVFGAQFIGAGETHRLRSLLRTGVALSYAVGVVLIGLLYLSGRPVLALFLTDPATLEAAYDILIINLWADLIFGNITVLAGLMRASGAVFWPTVLSLLSLWGVLVPTAWLLSPRLGLIGIWLAYPTEFAVGLAMQYAYYHFFWRKRQHTLLIS
jgi:putative MATE family efflux protein